MSFENSKKRILAVSFGTTNPEGREAAIGGIEEAVRKAVKDIPVKRCFTSRFVINKIAREEGITISNPVEAIDEAIADGVTELIVLPTHLMAGQELKKFRGELEVKNGSFERCVMAGPLLGTEQDKREVIDAIRKEMEQYLDGNTAIMLAGHGTEDPANVIYAEIQQMFDSFEDNRFAVATIESEPSFDDALDRIKGMNVKRVILLPFLVVCGDHVLNDIGGPEPDSWENMLKSEGYEAITIRHGLGEMPAIQEIYIAHLKELMN